MTDMLPVEELHAEKLSVELAQLELELLPPELPDPPDPPEPPEPEELLAVLEPQPAPNTATSKANPKMAAHRTYWFILKTSLSLETC